MALQGSAWIKLDAFYSLAIWLGALYFPVGVIEGMDAFLRYRNRKVKGAYLEPRKAFVGFAGVATSLTTISAVGVIHIIHMRPDQLPDSFKFTLIALSVAIIAFGTIATLPFGTAYYLWLRRNSKY